MATLQEIVTAARATRADDNMDPKQTVDGELSPRAQRLRWRKRTRTPSRASRA